MKKKVIILGLLLSGIYLHAQHITDITDIGDPSGHLIAVEKDGKWGFMDIEGNMAVPFRKDIVSGDRAPVFNEGLCLIEKVIDGIAYYGYMDSNEKTVIAPIYLNITPFDQGLAVAIVTTRRVRGKNQYLHLDIISNEFDEVVINREGETVAYLGQRKGILMNKRRYRKPVINSKILSGNLVAIKGQNGKWTIYKI